MGDKQRQTSSLGALHALTVAFGMEVYFHRQGGDVSIASSWESHLDSLSVFARIVWADQLFARQPRMIAIHYGIPLHSMESVACGLIIMNRQLVLPPQGLLKLQVPVNQGALEVP